MDGPKPALLESEMGRVAQAATPASAASARATKPPLSLRTIAGGRIGGEGDHPDRPLRLLIIDPRSLTRDCLVAALSTTPDIETVIPAATVREAIDALAQGPGVDAALINLAADPFGEAELADYAARLERVLPPGFIVLLTSLADPGHAQAALRQGFQGFLGSDTPLDVTVEAIRLVSRGWMVYPPLGKGALVPASLPSFDRPQSRDDYELTVRQRQVLEGLQAGFTNKDIATRLGVSERTVKAHVQELMRRLGASNRTQVVALVSGATRWQDGKPGD